MSINNRYISLLISIISACVVVQCTDNNMMEIKSNSASVPVVDVSGESRERVKRGISGSRLTYTERLDYLNKHNDFRKGVTPTASDMKFMVWNEELAKMAQEWADGCNWSHGNPARNPPPFTSIGQNIYAASGLAVTGTSVTTAWYDEVSDYTYSSNTCGAGKVCGHYTQVIWADSDHIGCALAECATLTGSSMTNAKYVVCNYGPAGNFVGSKPYTQGATCSACPAGTSCQANICAPSPKCGSKTCQNGGTLDATSCECDCPAGFDGSTCGSGDGGDGDDGNSGPATTHISLILVTWSLVLTAILKI